MPIYKMSGKRDGLSQYRVRINYIDALGKKKQLDRIAYGKAEASLLEAELKKQVSAKDIATTMSIAELYEEYIKNKKSEVRETSLLKTIATFKNHILPILKDVKLNNIKPQTLQNWKSEVLKKNLAFVSTKNTYKELSALFNYAVRLQYINQNPLRLVGNFKDPYFKPEQEKICYYTADQFKAFISVAKIEAQKQNNLTAWGYYVFFNIAFYTGMRKGEINALRWSDLEGDIIYIKKSITQKIKGKPNVETPPKNKSSYRQIAAPLPLLKILTEHKQRQAKLSLSANALICGGENPLRDTTLSNKNIEFAKLANIPTIRIHDFRHSHASLLINEGINIKEISRRLGHAKVEITWNTYGHLYPQEETKVLNILNNISID